MRLHRICAVGATSLLLLALGACTTPAQEPKPVSAPAPSPLPPPPPPPPPAPPPSPPPATTVPPPSVHVWRYLRKFGDEPASYATYSYVLAGRDASDAASTRRFEALVAAVQGSTASASDLQGHADRRVMNVFLIPANRNADTANLVLSKSLVAALVASDARFLRPGPFIVTLHQPISFSGSSELSMLFVDLTNTHTLAMQEIATAYKRRLSDKPLNGAEQLRELRLYLLNAALVAEDAIGFASAAYAQVKSAFLAE